VSAEHAQVSLRAPNLFSRITFQSIFYKKNEPVLQTASGRPWTATGGGAAGTFHKSSSKRHASTKGHMSLFSQHL